MEITNINEIEDMSLWAHAIEIAKTSDYIKEISPNEHISFYKQVYASLGGRFADTMVRKDNNDLPVKKDGESEIHYDDKHTDVDGKSMKEMSDEYLGSNGDDEGWTEHINEDTQTSRTFRDGQPIVGPTVKANKRSAQLGSSIDPSAMEPNLESDSKQVSNRPDIQGDEPTANGLVGKDKQSELMGNKVDNSDVVDAVRAYLAVLLTHAEDLELDGALEELKQVFSQDDLYNEFKGKISQEVDSKKSTKAPEDQTAKEFLETADSPPPSPNQAPQSSISASPTGPKQMALRLLSAPSIAVQQKRLASKMYNELAIMNEDYTRLREKYSQDISERDSELEKLRLANKQLLLERSVSIRLPRSQELAKKMYEIGEIEGEPRNDVIVRHAQKIVMLPDSEFMQLEKRVEKTYKRIASLVATNSADETEDDAFGGKVMSFIPNHIIASNSVEALKQNPERKQKSNENKFGFSGTEKGRVA